MTFRFSRKGVPEWHGRQPEFDARHGSDQRFVDVLNGLEEVGLTENFFGSNEWNLTFGHTANRGDNWQVAFFSDISVFENENTVARGKPAK